MLSEILLGAAYITFICLAVLFMPKIRALFMTDDIIYLRSALFAVFMMAITFNGLSMAASKNCVLVMLFIFSAKAMTSFNTYIFDIPIVKDKIISDFNSDIETINTYLLNAKTRSYNSLVNLISTKKQNLSALLTSYILKRPSAMYEVKEQKLDYIIDSLNKTISNIIDNNRIRLFKSANSYVLTNPEVLYKFKSQNLEHIISKLEVLNPMNTLLRGYAIVKKDNKVIDIDKIKNDDIINIDIKNGKIDAKVVKVERDNGEERK